VSLAVDVAFAGDAIYTASAAEPNVPIDDYSYATSTGVRSFDAGDMDATAPCAYAGEPRTAMPAGATIAVAAVPGRGILAQYREPARLAFVETGEEIALSGGSAANIGHSIFHEAVGTGATCASCHPEGGDDGRTWRFDVGARRTQTMRGGILATLPFHWAGDVPSGEVVMAGTFVGRMGATGMPLGYEIEAFESWVDAQPALPGVAHDGGAVDRGRAVFERAECGSCHSGSLGTNNETVDVGTGGRFQVPALHELAYRAPYMHDGRAATLVDAVRMHTSGLSDAEHADVAAYLRSR
jgi:mono/diheme cytochrome c family protein